jgi:hypothetical protein
VARAISDSGSCGCGSTAETSCCASDVALADKSGTQVFGAARYAETEAAEAPDVAVAASLGCGVPTAVADLHEGETVLESLTPPAGADASVLGASADEIRGFALAGLTRRLEIVGVPLDTL